MTPEEVMSRLDRICELVDLGATALNGTQTNVARLGRAALRLAKSEIATLKDEVSLANLLAKSRIPTLLPSTKKKK